MRRAIPISLAASLFAGSFIAAAPKPAPMTSEQMLARCKTAPDLCKAVVQGEAATLTSKGLLCVPRNVSKEEMTERVMDSAQDVVEEAPDAFKDGSYVVLVNQIILYLWNCKDHPIS